MTTKQPSSLPERTGDSSDVAPDSDRAVDKVARSLDKVERIGKAIFKSFVRLAELVALTVAFSVTATLTQDPVATTFAVLLYFATGLYVASAYTPIMNFLFPKNRGTIIQIVLIIVCMIALATGAFLVNSRLVSGITAMTEAQLRD